LSRGCKVQLVKPEDIRLFEIDDVSADFIREARRALIHEYKYPGIMVYSPEDFKRYLRSEGYNYDGDLSAAIIDMVDHGFGLAIYDYKTIIYRVI